MVTEWNLKTSGEGLDYSLKTIELSEQTTESSW